ncbi:methyltransferase family protein [Nocardioides zhouii]|uniref:Isoprenylcysteine carboxylmethyltransferase family protein n=1 Tax=Nocardioides zhouii TaxID=1168729 RepID=A0A4Q2SJK2_9ACTN|nr:isoprenylcysteine carboxylmethyltransferase family protein [Nocardioides zhouii]RYC05293.1 isoprenylcysteine carboxylmethyltransferase family protein [Nocardioides zhouii]
MTTTQTSRRLDPGRLVAVTLFTFFLVLNGAHLAQEDPLSSPLKTVATALTMAFYLLLIWAYLRRVPSDRTDLRWSSWLVAFAGTAAPFAIPLVSDGLATGAARESLSAAVLAIGLAAMLWALGALGTNISVVPQAREVVTHGPYAKVRHPLYAAELLNVVGLCLAHSGAWPWVVLVALAVFQVMRARREEALLAAELPGYAEYKSRTPMLVPALGRS